KIRVVDGTGQGQARLVLRLNDPGSRGNDGRITLPELTTGILNPGTLADLPELTGSVDLTLPVRASVGGLAPTIPPHTNPRARLHWADLSDPSSLQVDFLDLDPFLQFQDFGTDDILAALRGLADYLRSIEQFSFLNQKLPVLNQSIGDLISMGDRLAQ